MTIIINTCYGGYSIPDEFLTSIGIDLEDYDAIDAIERTDERFIKWLRDRGGVFEGDFSELRVVEIPDEATDWEMDEYDGMESITCVVGGKLCHIYH